MPPRNPYQRPLRPRSISENLHKLFKLFDPKDKALITIDADPDSLAAAMACRAEMSKTRSPLISLLMERVQ